MPGDSVIVLANDEGIEPGTVGVIESKWIDTLYAVRTKNGIHWVDRVDIDTSVPERFKIAAGDIVQVKSNLHNHTFFDIGDLIQVIKVMEDVDYYDVSLDGVSYWLSNFELAPYFPPLTS